MNQNLSDTLLQQLKESLFSGELLPGTELESQRRMSESWGVSRSTVREAVGQLEAEGYVEVRQGGKTRVNNLLEPYFNMPVEGMKALGDNAEFQRQVMDVRAMLEGEAAFYAASRATDIQLQALDAEYQQMQKRGQGETTLEKAKEDLRFHMMIAESSHHLLIICFSQLFYTRFFNAIYGVLTRTLKKHGRYPDGIRAQHGAIHQAIMAREADAARVAATEHILYTRQHLDE
ncbi:FadR/GntR family transcriptional regulator [Amphritea japonica]|uniref:Pyruvate dehydrogenase complex repressor n=1 Tax=Amphritea japonica ATCC BAA-1530 TaxID=1278309 RepID=A0A7R6STA0_9GAMM|nr:FadR/GntR family transcriptional regulator [Amphritea japonica]BBB27194.1 GntR family transcriptional regulator, transcriptional repressor for pyruvate dehydrogenase complex [Amphritea japonica ATCC BAA-1530]